MRKLLVNFLFSVVNSIFPNSKLNIYGSVVCGLDDEDSDIDIVNYRLFNMKGNYN
jgi:predicted nucleotidyltransferase